MSFAGASFAETPFASQGALDVRVFATGFGITTTLGTQSVIAVGSPVVIATGFAMTMYANTATAIGQQNPTIVTTGFAITGAISSVTAQGVATVIPGSLIAQLDLGTQTIIDLSANVPLVGINIQVDEGTLAPIGWTKVDDSSTMVWQKAA